MSSWTTKSHYPVVIVEKVNAGDDTTLELKQETFLLDDASAPAQDTLWEIPIMAVGSNKNGIRGGGDERGVGIREGGYGSGKGGAWM